MFFSKIAAVAFITSASLVSAQCVTSCGGSSCYYASDIENAVSAGYNYLQEGRTVGDDSYPHTYRDDEGFNFPDSGPWYEFPILDDFKTFDGSTSPGADRVIFDNSGDFSGIITHTGSSNYDGFVACNPLTPDIN